MHICEGNRRFLAATAILLQFLSSTGLLVEAVQFWMKGLEVLQWFGQLLSIGFVYFDHHLFIHGFDNECWCSTPWQWQIGAFAVFFSWIDFVFILKYIPYTAVTINIFLSICVKSLELIFLLLVLILTYWCPLPQGVCAHSFFIWSELLL